VVFRVINSWLRRLPVIDRIRSCASRLAFKVSFVRAWGAIAGTVKLLLPPRQSRGISLVIRPTRGAPDDIRERSKRSHSTPGGFPRWETKPVHKSKSGLPVAIAQGTVIYIGHRAHTLLRHSRAQINVKWYRHTLPPKVKIGATVMVMGKIMTFGNGRTFQLVDSVLVEMRTASQAARELSKTFERFIVDPSTYLNGRTANGHDQP
jgi:hypothetical protein